MGLDFLQTTHRSVELKGSQSNVLAAHFPFSIFRSRFNHWSRSDPRFQLLVAAGGKHIFTRARMATANGQGQHILFNYFNSNNDYYLHNLVLIIIGHDWCTINLPLLFMMLWD